MKLRLLGTLAVAAALAVSAHAPAGATTYTIKDLGTFGGSLGTVATGISNNGQICGYSYTGGTTQPAHAFLYSNGALHDLTPTITVDSFATGINALGDVCGYNLAGSSPTVWLYPHGNAYGALTIEGPGYGFGINRYDTIVGKDTNGYAAKWSGGKETVLTAKVAEGRSINIYNTVVGSVGATAAKWTPGAGLTLLPGAVETYAVNNSGYTVGVLYDSYNNPHAAALVNGVWDTMAAPTGTGLYSDAVSVNASNVIGGYITWYGQPHACLWTSPDQFPQMVDLEISNPITGMALNNVVGINDSGVLAVAGTINGQQRSFILTPQ